jgi:hypothetical protein
MPEPRKYPGNKQTGGALPASGVWGKLPPGKKPPTTTTPGPGTKGTAAVYKNVPNNPLEFLTPEQQRAEIKEITDFNQGINDRNAAFGQTYSTTKFNEFQNSQAAKQSSENARDSAAGRGVFGSSMMNNDLNDISTNLLTKNSILETSLQTGWGKLLDVNARATVTHGENMNTFNQEGITNYTNDPSSATPQQYHQVLVTPATPGTGIYAPGYKPPVTPTPNTTPVPSGVPGWTGGWQPNPPGTPIPTHPAYPTGGQTGGALPAGGTWGQTGTPYGQPQPPSKPQGGS